MKLKEIVIGSIVLVIVISSALIVSRAKKNKLASLPVPTPNIEQKVSDKFNGLIIPKDEDKAELKDVTDTGYFGVVTKTTVLADLPDLKPGYFYQVWSEKDGKLVSLGQMRMAKGGYILEGDFSGKVVISEEKILDKNLETKLLEGSL
jgi:hypothetical protein